MSQRRRRPVVFEPHDARRAGGEQPLHFVGDSLEERLGFVTARDERRDARQGGLLVGKPGTSAARLGVRDRRCNKLGEVREPCLGVRRKRLVSSRKNDHGSPQSPGDDDRARDGRAHTRAANDSSDLPAAQVSLLVCRRPPWGRIVFRDRDCLVSIALLFFAAPGLVASVRLG